MKKQWLYQLGMLLCMGLSSLQAQTLPDSLLYQPQLIQPDQPFDNILVKPLQHDSLSSQFIIWIRKEVKLHRHDHHTESVYVLEGEGLMRLGEKNIYVQPGTLVLIPKGVPHSVMVVSFQPMKVISIQSPYFDGKDRIMLEP